jgi:hypothetical protein
MKFLREPSAASRAPRKRGNTGRRRFKMHPEEPNLSSLTFHLHTHTPLAKQRFQISNRIANF